jgi:hypothetical protein
MISRTGDLVHLNALTFFEIFGFMQNENGLAMAKPRQGYQISPSWQRCKGVLAKAGGCFFTRGKVILPA